MPVDFQKRQRIKRLLYSPSMLSLLGLLVCVVLFNTWDLYTKERDTHTIRSEKDRELAELKKREAFLDRKLEMLGTPEGVEAEVRTRFGVAREGEQVMILVDQASTSEKEATHAPWWERVRGWFGK